MRLPDPFQRRTDQSQQDELAIRQTPRIAANVQTALTEPLKAEIDSYLQTRGPVSFLQDLPSKLLASTIAGQMAANAAQAAVAAGQGSEQAQRADTASTSDGATPSANATSLPGIVPSQQSCNRYNVSVLNAVVLYVGMQAIEQLQLKSQPLTMSTIAHTAFMDIYQNLAVSLDTEGRYLFFNAIANQLRYPNAHTHFFSLTLLYLFLEANSQIIQEQITRILFERLVALRPHPWGLLTTFIDLIKDDTYGFWNLEFTRCAPEIEKLFQSVAESCMVKQQSSAVEQ